MEWVREFKVDEEGREDIKSSKSLRGCKIIH